MAIIRTKGGLGNQLFQYAFGRRISILRKEVLYIDNGMETASVDANRKYLLDKFNIQAQPATKEQILKAKYPFGIISKIWRGIKSKILKMHNISWNEKILNSKAEYFDGFWQSYKYLDPIRKELLSEIVLKESIEGKYFDIISQIKNSSSVSIHIRRGDYVNDEKTKKAHYTFGAEYYVEAMRVIEDKVKEPKYFVFSDDIEWAKQNIQTGFSTTYIIKPTMVEKDEEELIIMSKCKHNIIANSSFSFWGAWLNTNENKVVIAPSKWNNKYQDQYRDLLPPEWIKI